VNDEPRQKEDYSTRQIEAARRVLIDVGQILASFSDCLVVVGGWVPDLLIPESEEPHVGSIDVDVALDAAQLTEGRYAEMLKLLLATKRYAQGEKEFQLVTDVDLEDGEKPVRVEVEFLAPTDVKLKKNKPKLLPGFRVLQTEACAVAFNSPIEQKLTGENVRGAKNTVRWRIASLPDFLIMKSHAIAGRDKPKDGYDFCYCLEHFPDGLEKLGAIWKNRRDEKHVAQAIKILYEKFESISSFGPQQVVEFYNSANPDERAMQARKAYELVRRFLELIE
jgi:hypothetical protein